VFGEWYGGHCQYFSWPEEPLRPPPPQKKCSIKQFKKVIILTCFLPSLWDNLHNLVMQTLLLLPLLKEHRNILHDLMSSFAPPFFLSWCILVHKTLSKSSNCGRLFLRQAQDGKHYLHFLVHVHHTEVFSEQKQTWSHHHNHLHWSIAYYIIS
jgi:hypothetical protein